MTPAPTRPVIKLGGEGTYENLELQLLKLRRGDVPVAEFLRVLNLVIQSYIEKNE